MIGTALPFTRSAGAETGVAVGVAGIGVAVGCAVGVGVGVAVAVGVSVGATGVAVGASVAVGAGAPAAATVTFALIARTLNPLFSSNRKLYVPDVAGILNDNVADGMAAGGAVFDPLRYR